MIPVCDVIPQRTPPVVTIACIAVAVVVESVLGLGPVGPFTLSVIALWLFGWTVEDRLGHDRFTLLIIVCAAAAWAIGGRAAAIDGAVGGVMAAYVVLYPRSLMLFLVPIPLTLVELPAFVLVTLWCLLQVLLGQFQPIAAALAAGAVLGIAIKRPERMRIEWWSPSPRA